MKRRIKKEDWASLSSDVQKLYTEKDGEYVLELEDDEDTGALKRAKDRLAQEKREAEDARRKAEQELEELRGKKADADDEAARKAGDIEKLEKSWSAKLKKQEDDHKVSLSKRDSQLTKLLVDNTAQRLAGELTDSPDIMLPHIRARLVADLDGDTPSVKVLDGAGELSSMSIEDLQKDFAGNKAFAPVIRANKSSGGGAPGDGNKGSALQPKTADDKANLAAIPPKELAAHIAAQKAAATD